MPDRVARHGGGVEVGLTVADWTADRRQSNSGGAALAWWRGEPGHIALARAVAGGMAVQTTRMRQHLAQLREYRRRAGRRIGDRGKTLDAREPIRRAVGNGGGHPAARRQKTHPNQKREARE